MNASRSMTSDRMRTSPGEQVILFSVGGSKLAIAASAVEEIRNLIGLQKLVLHLSSPKLEKVKQVLERQGRKLFVVDACEHFRLVLARPSRLLVLRQTPAAVMVDAIDGMVEVSTIQVLPKAFSGEERNWYRGLALIEGRVIPVVRPEAFLSKSDVVLIEASIRGHQMSATVGSRA